MSKPKNLLIIGARGFGREVYMHAQNSIGYGTEFVVKGYLDDKVDALDGFKNYPPIIDSVERYNPQQDDVFICALGDVKWKHHYVSIMLQKQVDFINIISKSAGFGPNTTIGKGCIILSEVGVSCDCAIGDFVTMQPRIIVGHDCVIGNFTHINTNVFLGGGVVINKFATLHTGAIIHPKMKIGDNAIVGAGAVVIKSVKPATTVIGNPAKLLKF